MLAVRSGSALMLVATDTSPQGGRNNGSMCSRQLGLRRVSEGEHISHCTGLFHFKNDDFKVWLNVDVMFHDLPEKNLFHSGY